MYSPPLSWILPRRLESIPWTAIFFGRRGRAHPRKLRSEPLRTLVAAKASLFPALLRVRDRALCVQDHSTQLVSKQLKLTYPHTWTVYIAHLLAIRRKGHRVNGQAFKINVNSQSSFAHLCSQLTSHRYHHDFSSKNKERF